jgi:hypothetical protein
MWPFSTRRFAIEVQGYPTRFQEIRSLAQPTLLVPTAFRKLLVLAIPGPEVVQLLEKNPAVVKISAEGKQCSFDYRPYAFWIGTTSAMTPPAGFLDDIKEQFKDTPSRLTYVSTPRSIRECSAIEPKMNSSIRVSIIASATQKEIAHATVTPTVWSVSPTDMIHREVIELPQSTAEETKHD